MPNLKNRPSHNNEKRFPENTLAKITAELDTLLPKIFLDAKITPLKQQIIKDTKRSVCISVTDQTSKKYFVKICPDNSIVTEIFWRKKAHENNIPTPRAIFVDISRKKIPYMFEVLEFIEGTNLRFVSSEFKYVFAKLIGAKLKKLHCIQVNGFGNAYTEDHWNCKTWREVLEKHMDCSTRNAAREIFTIDERKKLHKCTHDKKMIITHPKLLHGDINAGNFIYSEKRGEVLFLDPGYTIGGDPMLDLARTDTPSPDSVFFRGIKDGYETEIPLTGDESYRLEKLRLLCLASAVVGLYTKKDMKYAIFKPYAKDLLAKL
ncbi:MAG: aminoglycoside phosphotransferase family protein [Candidatus Aenigmarchaeota archaeon]|nr:aminoglycoside phosphotransferase family protein [Candidatus Aenigmarchaeota archaeon]